MLVRVVFRCFQAALQLNMNDIDLTVLYCLLQDLKMLLRFVDD